MKRIPLSEYARTHGQGTTAKELKVTQAAICKAVQTGRDIHIIIDKKGSVVRAEEIRSFPHQVK